MITVIDINTGNLGSVGRALKKLGQDFCVSDKAEDIKKAEKLIFPGVGSFAEASRRISQLKIKDIIQQRVLKEKIPILGICLGMQLLASEGVEGGASKGLELVNAKVLYHRAGQEGLRLPHIGWNDVKYRNFKLFDGIENNSCFYFVHSYEFIPEEEMTTAVSHYGVDFVASYQKDNIIGVQFHPEKSQKAGLKLLDNFCKGNI